MPVTTRNADVSRDDAWDNRDSLSTLLIIRSPNIPKPHITTLAMEGHPTHYVAMPGRDERLNELANVWISTRSPSRHPVSPNGDGAISTAQSVDSAPCQPSVREDDCPF
jgi:hypothetical protein